MVVTRQYTESFDVYGEKMSFEWQRREGDEPLLHTGGERRRSILSPTMRICCLRPCSDSRTKGVYDEEHQHLSFAQGGGHGGSILILRTNWSQAL